MATALVEVQVFVRVKISRIYWVWPAELCRCGMLVSPRVCDRCRMSVTCPGRAAHLLCCVAAVNRGGLLWVTGADCRR